MPKNSKRHDSTMLAAWARQYGIKGYEQFDPKFKEQLRIKALRNFHSKPKKK
jgi:hypothetical protein|tara:strand:- start:410 stop:565 length:156 start_codon:yes stop_codon:yes gene_type:complete